MIVKEIPDSTLLRISFSHGAIIVYIFMFIKTLGLAIRSLFCSRSYHLIKLWPGNEKLRDSGCSFAKFGKLPDIDLLCFFWGMTLLCIFSCIFPHLLQILLTMLPFLNLWAQKMHYRLSKLSKFKWSLSACKKSTRSRHMSRLGGFL